MANHRWKIENRTRFEKMDKCTKCGIYRIWSGGVFQCWEYRIWEDIKAADGKTYPSYEDSYDRPNCTTKQKTP